MTTIASVFTGGGGIEVGARAAGLTPLWGIEIKDEIAQVARDNGFHVITTDVMEVDPHTLEPPDFFHASPECQRASQANKNKGETSLDIKLGQRTIDFLDVLRPRVFTLENVGNYQRFESFKRIVAWLTDN